MEGDSSHIRVALRPNLRKNMVTLSERVGMALIRNCKRRSSHHPSALTSHHTLDNRKNTSTRLAAFFLQPDVHIADK
jgi:hypothetical protein